MGRQGPTSGTSFVYESVISWVSAEIWSSVRLARSGGRSALGGRELTSVDVEETVASGAVDSTSVGNVILMWRRWMTRRNAAKDVIGMCL